MRGSGCVFPWDRDEGSWHPSSLRTLPAAAHQAWESTLLLGWCLDLEGRLSLKGPSRERQDVRLLQPSWLEWSRGVWSAQPRLLVPLDNRLLEKAALLSCVSETLQPNPSSVTPAPCQEPW